MANPKPFNDARALRLILASRRAALWASDQAGRLAARSGQSPSRAPVELLERAAWLRGFEREQVALHRQVEAEDAAYADWQAERREQTLLASELL